MGDKPDQQTLLPIPARGKQRFGCDGGKNSSLSFGSDRDFAHPIISSDSESNSFASLDRDDDEDGGSSSASDCESVISGNPVAERTIQPKVGPDGLVELDESDRMYEIIKNRFVSGLRTLGVNVQVESIRRNMFSANVVTLARLQSFLTFKRAVESKNGGVNNLRYAWFGASKEEINRIILQGFGYEHIEKNGAFGFGLYLCADNTPIESVRASTVDADGTRHLLLCRVLLGKMEAVEPGSTQCSPSSEEFQSGVDNLASPRKLIVWSTHLNTHVLPEYIISFKTLPSLNELRPRRALPLLTFSGLMSALSKFLPEEAMQQIAKSHRKYKEHKISRRDMIQAIRDFAGDRLLSMFLKDFGFKQQLNRSN